MDRIKLWEPSAERIDGSQIRAYMSWLRDTRGVVTDSFDELHRWSIENIDDFWDTIWTYFAVIGDRGDGPVREGTSISNTRWIPGARLNYAENLLRHADSTPGAEAVVGLHETGERESLTWSELRAQVSSLSRHLREIGVRPGDTVAAVLPSLVQTPVAMLATASLGAIWSVVNTDFGVDGIADRFAQIEPSVLFSVDNHEFNGEHRDQLPQLPAILDALPSVRHHILIDTASPDTREHADLRVPSSVYSEIVATPSDPVFEPVDFSHPLWVLYSSGTTGKPKGIVHSHGGIVLESLKANALHYDVRPGDRVHFAVSTTWMVWNLMVDAMMRGATIITYDGAPTWQRPDRHLAICSEERATLFCAGAAILSIGARAGTVPKDDLDFTPLRTILSTGSPLRRRPGGGRTSPSSPTCSSARIPEAPTSPRGSSGRTRSTQCGSASFRHPTSASMPAPSTSAG
ncbi:AMP-binding protein [Brevibacterium casei]